MSMEIISDFIAAMEAAGVRPLEPLSQRLEDGKLIRFRSEGDKPGKLNGWAVLHLDGLAAGAFGNYRMGISEKWRAGKVISLTPIQRREIASAIRREQELRASERLQRQERAAAEVRNEWQRARDADPAHGYLRRKGISGEGLKQVGHWLLVPMHDPEGRLWNIQRIAPDGTKRFAKDARRDGLFWLIGQPAEVICIGEGYATCAVVRRAIGEAVAVSFSSANLTSTAVACRRLHRNADIVILADDDPHLIEHPKIGKNLGMVAAYAAAAAVEGRVAMPPREAAA